MQEGITELFFDVSILQWFHDRFDYNSWIGWIAKAFFYQEGREYPFFCFNLHGTYFAAVGLRFCLGFSLDFFCSDFHRMIVPFVAGGAGGDFSGPFSNEREAVATFPDVGLGATEVGADDVALVGELVDASSRQPPWSNRGRC